MADNDWKSRLGVVYSTNPDFKFETPQEEDVVTPSPERQNLRVGIERANRGGKVVTVVAGFKGSDADLCDLGKKLKTKFGVGGSAKQGEIILQGDFRDKVVTILGEWGYRAKRSN